jgi:uncharacterized protein (DUF433 family)
MWGASLYPRLSHPRDAEILEDYPFLEEEDILAALDYAAIQTNHPILIAA